MWLHNELVTLCIVHEKKYQCYSKVILTVLKMSIITSDMDNLVSCASDLILPNCAE